MTRRNKWFFILGIITLLILALTYLISERLIRHLDRSQPPYGHQIESISPQIN